MAEPLTAEQKLAPLLERLPRTGLYGEARREITRLNREIKKLREIMRQTADIALGIQKRYYQTFEGRREEDQVDFASGNAGYEDRSRARGLR
jgi:hypothetical protein